MVLVVVHMKETVHDSHEQNQTVTLRSYAAAQIAGV